MDCLGPILQIVNGLWVCSSNEASHILDLEENLKSLRTEAVELESSRIDVSTAVERAKREQMVVKRQVENWLQEAEILQKEIHRILDRGEREIQNRCVSGYCPTNCRSSYTLGKEVEKMLERVKEAKGKRDLDVVADTSPLQVVDERPVERTVGLDMIFEHVWRCLNEGTAGVLGLYGMGGVGKTTLLTKLNNAFASQTHSFDLVIWVVVSKQARLEEIQEVIGSRLNIQENRWAQRNMDSKATMIYNFLKAKKFVLLLDDIWERLDLTRVGVPFPDNDQNKQKVVFTTRSKEVCCQMEAAMRIKVTCLGWDEALALFKEKVGEDTLSSHPEIPKLAEVVAKECDGLPLALITIGRAMSSKRDPREWRRAIEVLKTYPSKFSGMSDHVFPILKFSYDSLPDETIKTCFLYCSIFPEDYNIPKNKLVELWLGEGLMDESDVQEARGQGIDYIESLKLACLLETGNSADTVRMHDVVRDMALWLSCDNGARRNKVIVHEYIRAIYTLSKWNEAERITLWGANSIHGSPSCPELLTLFLRDSQLWKFPPQFFHCMPAVRVLDLSSNGRLVELPVEIKQLEALEYLNLSNTGIKELPWQLRKLTRMRHLLLDSMDELRIIPQNVISSFSGLRVLSITLCQSAEEILGVVKGNILSGGKIGLLKELERSEHVSDLCLTISSSNSARKLLGSYKFRRIIRLLILKTCQDLTEMILPTSTVEQMGNLEELQLKNCRQLREMRVHVDEDSSYERNHSLRFIPNKCFAALRSVTITDSPLKELTWLVYAPTVETLVVQSCKLLEDVIRDSPEIVEFETIDGIFSRLKDVVLLDLPKLRSIFPRPLSFPVLEDISVTLCPNLKKLPFNSTSARSLKRITGWTNWWNQLQWENGDIEAILHAHFSSI